MCVIYLYQIAEIKPDGSEIARKHAEEVKSVSKPVNITTHRLLPVSICYFCFKLGNLVEAHIPPFTNLNILMMSNVATTQCGIET